MAARVPRVALAGPRGNLAAEQVVKAHDPERKRSGFREPRREKRSSRQTVSQVGVPPSWGHRALFMTRKHTCYVHA